MSDVIIVTGMDRSGTSWVAGALRASGLFMGEELYQAGRGNKFGHFEDQAFLNFHIRLLQATNLEGLYSYDSLDRPSTKIPIPPSAYQTAQQLIKQRTTQHAQWGFKDPRATLFLNFWQRLIPEVKIICLYRSPLETALSLFNRGDGFANLSSVFRAFRHRMRPVLAFKRRFPEQMMLANIHRIIAAPADFSAWVAQQFALSLPDLTVNLEQSFRAEAFSSFPISERTLALFETHYSRAAHLFEQLEEVADLPGEPAHISTPSEASESPKPPPEDPEMRFFLSLVEDGLAEPAVRQKIAMGLLENIKVLGRVQAEHTRLHQEIARSNQEREILRLERDGLRLDKQELQAMLQQQETHYEQQLASLDLTARRLFSLLGSMLKNGLQNPRLVVKKLQRWYRARVKNNSVKSK